MGIQQLSLGLGPVSSVTLADQIADRIVDGIVSGHLASGQRLVEAALAAELQVSRVPVREAMQALYRQGLLVTAPGRGLRVADFDSQWARQLCDVRLALERICTGLVATKLRAQPNVIARLDSVFQDLRQRALKKDWDTINRLDITFHATLFDLADSPLLSALWSGIARHVLILFSIERSGSRDFDRVVQEHESYKAVLMTGDQNAIEIELEKHLRTFKILE